MASVGAGAQGNGIDRGLCDLLPQYACSSSDMTGQIIDHFLPDSALLLYRPSPGCPRPGRKAMTTVLASSSYIIRIYRRMQLNNRISWLWMTVSNPLIGW